MKLWKLFLSFSIVPGILAMGLGCEKKGQAPPSVLTQPALPQPPPPPKPPANTVDGGGLFLSKDPQFWKYVKPQLPRPESDNEFITAFSQSWKSQQQNAQSTASQISDPDLRQVKLKQLIAAIDLVKCMKEAQQEYVKQNESYGPERAAYFANHLGDWYELGKLSEFGRDGNYPPQNTLPFTTTVACLFPGGCQNIEMDLVELDKVYTAAKNLFSEEAENLVRKDEAEIEERSQQQYGMSFLSWLEKENRGLRTRAQLEEDYRQARPEMVEKKAKELRYVRLFLVASGDVRGGTIQKLGILDFPTNTMVYLFGPSTVEKYNTTATSTSVSKDKASRGGHRKS